MCVSWQAFGGAPPAGSGACRRSDPCQPLSWWSQAWEREKSWMCPSVGLGPSSPCPGVPSFWFMVPAFGFSISIARICCLNFSCLTTFMGELAFHSLIQNTSQFIAHTTESFNWIYICLDSTCQCGMNLHQVQLSFTELLCNPHSKCSKTGMLLPPWAGRSRALGAGLSFSTAHPVPCTIKLLSHTGGH